ncbi:MAG TPA: hypothetical protein VK815_08670 [Candidatus Acidoferrales bacterium]|jgi:hypothetical protein|nr:hypothetical protein [Candidatus Acidoferrales bacterium]
MSRDYMLRMIEQIAAMLARLLAKKQAGQIAEARSEAENLSLQNIGLTLTELKRLSPEAVAQLLDKMGGLRTIRALTLAELLLVDAELHEANQIPNQSLANYVHAFCLLADEVDKLAKEEQTFYRAKLDLLAGRLGDLREHPYIKARLRDFGTSKKAAGG